MMTFDYLTPTILSEMAYCPTGRLSYIDKHWPNNGEIKEFTVLGLFEHSVFEKYYHFTQIDWQKDKHLLENNDKMLDDRISLIVNESLEIGRTNFPLFLDHLEKAVESIKFRLACLNKIKLGQVAKLVKNGMLVDTAVAYTLPIEIEKGMHSSQYGLKGRPDLIYKNPDGSITVEDIKSHDNRYDAFIHSPGHLAQGIAYTIMAEEMYGKPCKKFQIFYSMDCHIETHKITKQLKLNVINSIGKAHNILRGPLPPRDRKSTRLNSSHT